MFPAQTAYAVAGEGASEVKRLDVSYHGQANRFVFTPGTETNPDNLFDMLVGLMPGDTRSQELTVRNEAASGARVNLYLCAYVPKLGDGASVEEIEADAKVRAFLKRLTFTVTSTHSSGAVESSVNPDGRPQRLTDWAYLGSFAYHTTSDLNVEVSVPAVLADADKYGDTYEDNDFQDLSAKIHWAFYVEEFNDTTPGGGGGGGDTPEPTPPGGNTPDPVPGGGGAVVPGGGLVGGGGVAAQAAPQAEEAGAELEELEDLPTPLAPPDEEMLGLPEPEVPLAGPGNAGSWALLNFALMNLAIFESVMLLIGYFIDRKDEKEEEKRKLNKKALFRINSLPVAVVSLIAFLLTEDISLPTGIVDKYTIIMVLIAVIQTMLVALSKKKYEDEEKREA